MANLSDAQKNRKTAQRYVLLEHTFNTLADRMWLYAAGLLLIDVVLKLDKDSAKVAPISISSLYGLVLSMCKVLFVGPIGSLIDRLPKYVGALSALLVQNISVGVNCLVIIWLLKADDSGLNAIAAFSIVTALSCISILASVALMNIIGRDWILEITTNDEITTINSWMRGIDQISLIIASGLAGLAISFDSAIGAAVIAGFNILAMFIQIFAIIKVYNMSPSLKARVTVDEETDQNGQSNMCSFKNMHQKIKAVYESWVLFFKSDVWLPGIVLGTLYLNVLSMNYPQFGYGRQSCLSEATLAVINVLAAVSGFIAPFMFPFLVRFIGLINTGIAAGSWQIFSMILGVLGLFAKGSEYYLYTGEECPLQNINDDTTLFGVHQDLNQDIPMAFSNLAPNDVVSLNVFDQDQYSHNDTFWISCPVGEDGEQIYEPPTEWISIIIIFLSSVFQRWGVYIFDMCVTQLFQLTVESGIRNRVAAGQYSICSMFSIAMYFFGLIWTETCDFGTGILICTGVISFWYLCYFVWARTKGSQLLLSNAKQADDAVDKVNEDDVTTL